MTQSTLGSPGKIAPQGSLSLRACLRAPAVDIVREGEQLFISAPRGTTEAHFFSRLPLRYWLRPAAP